jgi:hypothetical protein
MMIMIVIVLFASLIYSAHGVAPLIYSDDGVAPLLEDNVSIRTDVSGRVPNPRTWGDSYSVGDSCFCATSFDHDIGPVMVDTILGEMTIKEVCDLLGEGPGIEDRPRYNDIQCGNGPPNNAGDEDDCPGRIEHGKDGCRYIGPMWNFSPFSTPSEAPEKAQVKAPVNPPVKVPVNPVPVKLPVKVPIKVPINLPVKVPVKVPATAPVEAPADTVCNIIRLDLWNARRDTVMRTLTDGTDICSDRFISIEAITDECVKLVDIVLTGPDDYEYANSEGNPPYFLFENDGSDAFGETLSTGTYTVVVTPDRKASLAKTISFTVKDCP